MHIDFEVYSCAQSKKCGLIFLDSSIILDFFIKNTTKQHERFLLGFTMRFSVAVQEATLQSRVHVSLLILSVRLDFDKRLNVFSSFKKKTTFN